MAEGSGEVVAVSATGAANGLNNGVGGTSATTSNPLSRKLHKILETRLDNDKSADSKKFTWRY
ncbi:COG6 isoform 9 [Pongo abelii]|uniref:COG6 isoform 9 n=1 Tax=Pongo abelii TaxID=9601 RepID=A0A2J8VSY7_PONAB|nr:COG6 isoform 9 [Pongo abelii]